MGAGKRLVPGVSPEDADFPSALPPSPTRSCAGLDDELLELDSAEAESDQFTSVVSMLNAIDIQTYHLHPQPVGGNRPVLRPSAQEIAHTKQEPRGELKKSTPLAFDEYEARILALSKQKPSSESVLLKACITPDNILEHIRDYVKQRPELACLTLEETLLAMLRSESYYPGPHWLVRPASEMDVERADVLWRCMLDPSSMEIDDVEMIFFEEKGSPEPGQWEGVVTEADSAPSSMTGADQTQIQI